jgi:HD superfamily phosphodiesterase
MLSLIIMKNRKRIYPIIKEVMQFPEVQSEKGIFRVGEDLDVFNHTQQVVKNLNKLTSDKDVLVAGCLHDIGKIKTKKQKFRGHDKASENITKGIDPKFFKNRGLNQNKIAKLVGLHHLIISAVIEMRKITSYSDFEERYKRLEEELNKSGLKKELLDIFIADSYDKSKKQGDLKELILVKNLLSNKKYNLKDLYLLQLEQLEKNILEIPELLKGKNLWQNKFHEFDVYRHTLECVKHLKKLTLDKNIIVAGYFHDIGKPVTAVIEKEKAETAEKHKGKQYHDFDDHEYVGKKIIDKMNPDFFKKYGLDKNKIARLVEAHYLPMKGVKAMRNAKSYSDFKDEFKKLELRIDKSGLSREEVLLMFLADKLAQGKFCTDKEELFLIKDALLARENCSLAKIYEIQKKYAKK